jgi:phosphatidylglycerophosphate synthase
MKAIILPNALTASRLFAGPAFLLWGTLPARGLTLALLIAAVVTDLVDGRIARALRVTSNFGGCLDSTADKVFALALMLALAEKAVLPWWAFAALLAQYLMLAAAGSIYIVKFRRIPVPDIAAHSEAALAVAAVIVGVIALNSLWTTVLAIGLMTANLWHITMAWRRVVDARPTDLPAS